jgi:virulence factor Mce-like protein
MRRIVISATVVVAVVGLVVFATGASNGSSSGGDPTYQLELDNSFGLTTGEQMKVGGVPAGKITKIDLPPSCINGNTTNCHALITFKITETGFGSFHKDAFCQSRPQSLIGEYFINCDPGNSGPVLKANSKIPISRTQSTIPGDLIQAVMRLPYRERLTLIINELGAGVAGNSQNLQAALDRAVPALTETDSLLNLLANDSHTIQHLTTTANTLVSALANGSDQIKRFLRDANTAATDTATQNNNLKATFQNLPSFLEQLRPTLAQLGTAVNANEPALVNLNTSAGNLNRLLRDFPSFANSSRVALTCNETVGGVRQPPCPGGGVSLGTASVTGKAAIPPAQSLVNKLNQFTGGDNCTGKQVCLPELAQNLSIVLHDLNDRSRATEPDSRSPNGQGYTGLEAVLQYVFQQTLNLDYLGPWGHVQAIDSFISPQCSNLATPGTIKQNLQASGPSYRNCYSFLGPNQPGVNSPDPSSPGACPPDPGGQPPYAPGGSQPSQTGCTASAASRTATPAATSNNAQQASPSATAASSAGGGGSPTAASSSGGQSGSAPSSTSIGQLLGASNGAGTSPAPASSPSAASSSSTGSSSSAPSGPTTSPNQAQQLLNYLLSP